MDRVYAALRICGMKTLSSRLRYILEFLSAFFI